MKRLTTLFRPAKTLLLLAFLLIGSRTAVGQTWPVTVSVSLVQPFTGYWTDYSDGISNRFAIAVTLNDFNLPQYQTNLIVSIEGPNGLLVSKTPLVLYPGEMNVLQGDQISPFEKSGGGSFDESVSFVEGSYMLKVVAFDAWLDDRQVSNEAMVPFYYALKEPPTLLGPYCSSVVQPLTPQSVIFQWSAAELYNADPSWNTSYLLKIFRVGNGVTDTMSVVQNTYPIYSIETDQNFYVLGPTDLELDPFYAYVWRVQAVSSSERSIFKNDGYSEACTFTYGRVEDVIAATINFELNAQGISHRLGVCSWSLNASIDEYHLQVRKKGTQNWFDYYSTQNLEKITNLEPETTYEARLRGEGDIETDWTDVKEFVTKPVPEYNCDNSTMPFDALTAQPLPVVKANPGLIIQTGQFEVFTTSITPLSAPGHFSGEGYAIVFSVFPLAVEWNDIYIDDNNRHISGIIQAKTKGIDAWTHEWDVAQAADDPIWVPGSVDSVWLENNQYCYTFDDGTNTQTVCTEVPYDANVVVIQDNDGNQYVVTIYPEPGSVSGPHNYLTYLGDSLAANDSLMVTFEAAPNQQFGFDKKEHVEWILNYEPIRLGDSTNYFVPWKSIGKGQSDVVQANVDFAGFDENILKFKSKAGNELSKTGSGGTYTVTVPSNAECVYAWYGNMKLGKLNVVEYDTLSRRVVIVPVNGATLNAANIQTELNSVYGQANVSWTVSTAAPFSFDLGNDGLEAADANLFSKYSPEMRALRDSFRTHDTAYDKHAYYLFVVPNFSDPSQQGYMVRGRAVGFLASGATTREAAHELGHGAFGLEHTFPEPAEGSTTNLMDYATGTKLNKPQWDAIHSKMPVFNWLDEEEDGSSLNAEISETFLSDDLTTNVYTTYATLYHSKYQYDFTFEPEVLNFNPQNGSFYSDGIKYQALYYVLSGKFFGFYDISTFSETKEILNKKSLTAPQIENNDIREYTAYSVEELAFNKTFFSETIAEQDLISYWTSNNIVTTTKLSENEAIVNSLVAIVNSKKNNTEVDDEWIGEDLAEKLTVYSQENNRKFIIAWLEVNTVSLDQNDWANLASVVFQRTNLPADAILITVPYTVHDGLVNNVRMYNYMPGLASGNMTDISIFNLKENYNHIQSDASLSASGVSEIAAFIKDAFKYTSKKKIDRLYSINFKGDIIEGVHSKASCNGYYGTYNMVIMYDKRFDAFSTIVSEIESRQPYYCQAHGTQYQELFNVQAEPYREHLRNFIEEHPSYEFEYVDHGLKEINALTNPTICSEYVKWFRDRFYSVDMLNGVANFKTESPAGEYFNNGINTVVYHENLAAIDALGAMLSPINLDFIADGIGCIYASYCGDGVNASIYGAGIFMPVVSGVMLKEGKVLVKQLVKGEAEVAKVEGQYVIRMMVKNGDEWITYIGKNIDDLSEAPIGYQFYNYNGNKFLRRIDASNTNTPRLAVKDGKIVKYDGQTIDHLTISQVNELLVSATKNPSSENGVMLGKYNTIGVSYDIEAKNGDYIYFNLENYDAVYKLVNESKEEMWKINEEFIKKQFNANKSFYFSHNPNDLNIVGIGSFYDQEIRLLKELVSQKYNKVAKFTPSNQYWKLEW